jgi:hypothetical protein
MPLVQRAAWGYFAAFLAVVVITHFPGLTDAQGRNLGLFTIDPIDDVAHALSALLAGFAAWQSARVSLWFLRLFGGIYGLDGAVGFLLYLPTTSLVNDLAINLPHMIIAAVALAVGLVFYRRG